VPWWRRLLDAIGKFFQGIGTWLGARLEKLPAGGVFWSAFWVVFALAVMIVVTGFWLSHYDHRLRDFRGKGLSAQTRPIEVPTRSGAAK
jgi:hypothetical protein